MAPGSGHAETRLLCCNHEHNRGSRINYESGLCLSYSLCSGGSISIFISSAMIAKSLSEI
jgi:hypothetical protein